MGNRIFVIAIVALTFALMLLLPLGGLLIGTR